MAIQEFSLLPLNAVRTGGVEEIPDLIGRGANVDQKNDDGLTPPPSDLQRAIRRFAAAVVSFCKALSVLSAAPSTHAVRRLVLCKSDA